jgi:flagellar hook-length control protein FliK
VLVYKYFTCVVFVIFSELARLLHMCGPDSLYIRLVIMNTALTNLMTPPTTPGNKPSAGVSMGADNPKKLVDKKVTDKGGKNTQGAGKESSARAASENSAATLRPQVKNGKAVKKTLNGVVSDPTLLAGNVENPIDSQTKPLAPVDVFATILQAAQQSKETPLVAPAKPQVAVDTVVKGLGVTPGQPDAKPAATNLPANAKQAAAVVVPQVPTSGNEVLAQEPTDSALSEIGKSQPLVSNTVVNTGLADQIANQTRKPIQSAPVKGSDVLKESSMPVMQGAAPVADSIARSARPVRPGEASSVRGKVTLQTRSTRQGQAAVAASPAGMNKQADALLASGDRPGRSEVRVPGQSAGQDAVTAVPVSGADVPVVESVAGGDSSSFARPVNQIAEAFESSAVRNGQEIVFRLDPPELGKVSVKLRIRAGEVRGVLEVDNPNTLRQLQNEAPGLLTRLTEAGVDMKRMDLSLSDDGSSRESMRDGAWFAQQYDDNGSGSDSWISGADDVSPVGAEDPGEYSPALATIGDDSINVWI